MERIPIEMEGIEGLLDYKDLTALVAKTRFETVYGQIEEISRQLLIKDGGEKSFLNPDEIFFDFAGGFFRFCVVTDPIIVVGIMLGKSSI